MVKAYRYLFAIATMIAGLGNYYLHGSATGQSILFAVVVVILILGVIDKLSKQELSAIGNLDPALEVALQKLQADINNNVVIIEDIYKLFSLISANMDALQAASQSTPAAQKFMQELKEIVKKYEEISWGK